MVSWTMAYAMKVSWQEKDCTTQGLQRMCLAKTLQVSSGGYETKYKGTDKGTEVSIKVKWRHDDEERKK